MTGIPQTPRGRRIRFGWQHGVSTILWVAVAGTALAQSKPVVRLTPDPVGLRETALLEIKVEGMATNLHFDAGFEVDNLQLISGPQQSTALEIVNSVRSTRRTLSWRVRPLRVGEGRVHQIEVAMGDQTVSLEPVTITIQQDIPADRLGRGGRNRADPFGRLDSDSLDRLFNRNRQPRRPREAPKVFLRAEATPAQPFVGQQVVYTLYLYTQVDILSFSHQELPDFQGFWAHEIPHPDQRQPEMVEHEGGTFGRVILLQRALFPRRDGRYEIAPVRVQMAARVPDNSPFGGLLARSTELERTSNAMVLHVQPLPTAPPGFTGAVGRLRMTGELTPANLAVGDAATLTLTLSGPGQLKGIPQPSMPELPGIKVFPPQQQATDNLRGTTLMGRRIWSFVLVPERPGTWDLPPIGVPYFDPRAGEFRNASVNDLQLVARGATSLPQASGDTVSLHPTRTAALPSASASLPFDALRPWLFGTPFVLAGLLLLWRRRSGGGRQLARRTLLAALDDASHEDNPRRVAAQVEDTWRAYLEARWDVPTGSPSPRWRERLMAAGVGDREADQLVQLADDLHYLRYAPKLSSTNDLRRELIERSRKLAKTLK